MLVLGAALVADSACTATYTAPDGSPKLADLQIYYRFGISTTDVGGDVSLQALSIDSDGVYRDVSRQAVWTSLSPTIARSNGDGSFSAVGSGVATLAAAFGGLSATTTVPLRNFFSTTLPYMSVNVSILIQTIGDTGEANAILRLLAGTSTVVTSRAAWRSSEERVATVAAGGRVTAVGTGTVDISATADGLTGTYRFSIFPRTR